ncbi:tyrosine-type recombinase/integrase [Ruegeria sp. HKCCA4633]|uniref:tyrosine-type recombinase/integrase n=1 Tax=Ruegeria sp. HKCCA4633 TaxID=2682983 RepID=UPI001489C326|nr:tyrosine-type recombinase/integrase [Ruegeria sp. HKCCA4633]
MNGNRNLVNFNSVPDLRKAAIGTYAHDGDRFPNMKFRVGKTKRSWTYRGRINGKFKSVVLGTFPDLTAAQAFKRIEKEKVHHGNEATTKVATVRDAWGKYRIDARANKRASEKHLDDLERKLDAYASTILDTSPTRVSTMNVRDCLNEIESVATRHHVKAALSSAFSMLDITTPIQRGKIKLAPVGDRATLWEEYCKRHPDQDPEDWSPIWNAIMAQRERNVLRGTAWIVMFFTGIRSEDVRELEWSQVNLQRGEIELIQTKSGIDRTISICDTVVRALTAIQQSDSKFVFPTTSTKTGETIHLDHLDRLKHPDNREPILRQHDTRKHFQEASNEAMLPENVMLFLRGDKSAKGGQKMLLKYTRRVGKTAPAMIEEVILERIKVTPAF